MNTEIQNYLAHIANGYAGWKNIEPTDDETTKQVRINMISEFCAGLTTEEGSKYIKVVIGSGGQRSVHSFIVKRDDGKFKAGDILKAAGWAAPAKNFARGNVLTGDFGRISWAGA